ncbi:uncharacterized protein LOC104939810 isoform X2 [Larimichthys crocea]|uniref:uncharacterized protein LOC104939810 isoform X2 n=1 Tax=Larimichthys crocea TaxID=215358 RepID=UPI000F5E3C93|nr:uncharacterized protein LOC104939810 isoform X2 [Larimichthys crocea]
MQLNMPSGVWTRWQNWKFNILTHLKYRCNPRRWQLWTLVNDDHKHPNCKMKRIITEAKPHLCLFALRDIQPGEEITYNYGGNDWPWRKQTEEQSCAADPCDTEDPRTAEKMAESPSSSVMQDSDEPEIVLSTNRVGIMSHLVDYSDSDEAQGPCTSPSQLNESCQDRQCIPRLRRTKSLLLEMKGQIDFDSDKLFDPTSDDSGEEYTPKSGQDSSM